MKLLKAEEMRDIDRRASEEYFISSLVLMENAGLRVFELVKELVVNLAGSRIVILAGQGNNGGDGLVLARHLHNAGARADCFLLGESAALTPDAAANYAILERMGIKIAPLQNEADGMVLVMALTRADIVVDAIYGTGFRGQLNEYETWIVETLNKCRIPTIAVDIPSGVEADTGRVHGQAVQADYTVTLALPKAGLVLAPGCNHVGQLVIGDISIPRVLLEDRKYKTNLIDSTLVKKYSKPRRADSHKGTYGHVLVVGGSTGMSGAVIMTAGAALRSGAGLVTAAVPESLVPVIESSIMEVMSRPLPQTSEATISLDALPAIQNMLGTVSVCAIGPGMARYMEANAILRYVLENSGVPVLIDADGLNALEDDVAILQNRQVPVVLTPHPGEMARLTGLPVEEIQHDRWGIARKYAVQWGVTLVLKGHNTVIANPAGELFININGNPGMATAGSGDVLAGIITGFIAQGMKPQDAAVAGVYTHGLCGDLVASLKGQQALVAGDLIEYLPQALQNLE